MNISFDEIPEEGMVCDINDWSWFPAGEVSSSIDPLVHFTLKKIDTRVVMKGSISCSVEMECDRCLSEFVSELESEFTLFFDWVGTGKSDYFEVEHQLTENEMDIVELEDPVIDIFETLQQQFYLMLPAKIICKEQCKGLCVDCGTNMNLGLCSCDEKFVDGPFSGLTKLKNH